MRTSATHWEEEGTSFHLLVPSCLAILSPSVLCLCALLVHNVPTHPMLSQSNRYVSCLRKARWISRSWPTRKSALSCPESRLQGPHYWSLMGQKCTSVMKSDWALFAGKNAVWIACCVEKTRMADRVVRTQRADCSWSRNDNTMETGECKFSFLLK